MERDVWRFARYRFSACRLTVIQPDPLKNQPKRRNKKMKTTKTKADRARVKINPVEKPPPIKVDETGLLAKRLLGAGAIILILHGVMELLPSILWIFPSASMPTFIFNEIAENWQMILWVSLVAAALRMIAALGILRNLKWGWILGILISLVTFAMLTFYLPMGIVDAVLSGSVLVLLVIGRYQEEKILG
jgi:hypothetical protein